ncbi:Pbp1p [Sporobolomyces salmoneus]|uniref:Pbp1p n=1 Tax=Sporobolomyces salmoneus TaxID=183962 RepID=UPI00317011B2
MAAKRPAGARPSTSTSSPSPSPGIASNGISSSKHAHDRLCLLLLVLVGQSVVATLKGGVRVQGILSAATTDGEVSISLRQAVYLSNNQDSTPKSSLIINARDLVEVEASDVVLDPSTSSSSLSSSTAGANKDSFRTDTDISGLPPPSRPRERDLQAWSSGAEGWGAGGIEDSAANGIGGLSLDDDFSKSTNGRRGGGGGGGGGAWDQFAVNERMYGLKTDYDEEIYTTKLDRNTKDFKDREARAAQLEKEILKGTSGLASNAHMAEERGEQVDDGDTNEEDRYGAVQRNPGAYVPPGARKAALARLGGATSPNPPAATNGNSTPPAPSSRPAALSANPPTLSRIPPTVRIPGSANSPANATAPLPTPSKPHPPVDETFRDFVREEKERLEKKKAALLQQQAKAEKDSRLRSLVQFSQSFKNPYPITDEIANMMHGKKSPAGETPSSTKASSTTVSPAAAPRQLPPSFATNGAKLAPPSSTAQPPSTGNKGPSPVAKKSILLADIPPFNPAKAAARQAELAAQKAAKEGKEGESVVPTTSSPSTAPPTASTSNLTPQPPKSKISATAAPFVFKPNPNATSFTPGSSTTARKPSVVPSASPLPSPKPQPQAVPSASGSTQPAPSSSPPNPFFGTKPLKRAGSSSLNVKEDFTPFRLNAVLPDPSQAVPSWPFTGKPYRSMYPPQATPLSLADEQAAYQNAIAAQQAAMSQVVGLDPSVSPAPPTILPPHHPHHSHHQQMSMHPSAGAPPAPPPPGSQAAAVAMGMAPYPGMNVHPQHQQQMAMMAAAAASGGGGGGLRQMYPQMTNAGQGQGQGQGQGHPSSRGGQQPQQQHMAHAHSHPGQMGFVPPPYHLQQTMSMGGGFAPGQQQQGHMFTSPSMQPQPTPTPPGGPGGPPQPSPRYAPYHPYSAGANGPPPPPGSVPPQGFIPQQPQQGQ